MAGRLPIFCHPRESVRVNDCQDRIANTLGTRCVGAESRGSKRGVSHGLEIVLRDRRCGQITKRFLRVTAIDQVGDQLGIDRFGRNVRQLLDKLTEDFGKGGKKLIVEVERF